MRIGDARMREATPSTDDLLTVAQMVTGRPVRWYRGGPKGEWDPQERRISIRYGMSDAQTRSTLAHEIVHALHDDPPGHSGSREQRAHRHAAHLLIAPEAYIRSEQVYGSDEDRIAEDLNVTRYLVQVWKQSVAEVAQHRPHCP